MVFRAMMITMLTTGLNGMMSSCTPPAPHPLSELGTIRIQVKERVFEVWIADDNAERVHGLMYITAKQMSDLPDGTGRGMLFVYDYEQHITHWMKNTIIPLDIAYLDTDGIVVSMYTAAPLDDRPGQYPSGAPVRFVLEVNANVLSELGVEPGDRIEIPSEALKHVP